MTSWDNSFCTSSLNGFFFFWQIHFPLCFLFAFNDSFNARSCWFILSLISWTFLRVLRFRLTSVILLLFFSINVSLSWSLAPLIIRAHFNHRFVSNRLFFFSNVDQFSSRCTTTTTTTPTWRRPAETCDPTLRREENAKMRPIKRINKWNQKLNHLI